MNRGFIQIPILIVILAGIAVFGGTGYIAYETRQGFSVQTGELGTESNTELSVEGHGDVSTTSVIKTGNDDIEKEIPSPQKMIVPTVISEAPVPPVAAPTQTSLPAQIKTPGSTTTAESSTTQSPAPTVTPTPKVKVTASPSSVEYDSTAIISWVATDALSCTLNSSPVLLAVTGSQSVTPTDPSKDWAKSNKTTYTVTCTGAGGSASGDTTVTVQPWIPPAGYKVLPAGQCNFATAPCVTGPGGMFCSKSGCGA